MDISVKYVVTFSSWCFVALNGVQLRATLPVSIFISPNIAIDENNNLRDQTLASSRRAADEFAAHQAPPLYGEHQFDQLYSEVDPNGYRTPGPGSGPGTPFGPLSRNISAENLASMNALTNTDISASALHSRLTSLTASRFGTHPSPNELPHESPTDAQTNPQRRQLNVHFDYFGPSSGSNSHSPASPELSRRPSDEVDHEAIPSGMATPFHPQYAEVETLSRVPSYSTAVRATVGGFDSNLPDYNAVIASDLPTPPVLQSPQQAYFRNGRASGVSTPMEVNRPGFQTHGANADDVERRLRLAQARARA